MDIDEIIGVTKAYLTRVGEGPFPTELNDATGEAMRAGGGEFGTTTGRPRRCGWLDLALLRYAVRVNTLTGLAITKLDVLSRFDIIKVCTGYRFRDEFLTEFPCRSDVFAACEPVYQDMPGWKADISGATSLTDLPLPAREYLEFIQEQAGVPIKIVSVGPERRQTVMVDGEVSRTEQGKFLFQDDLTT